MGRPFEEAEVKATVFDYEGDKSSGLVGFTLELFQHYFETIREDMLKVFEEFDQNGVINMVTKETYICLILKKLNSCGFKTFAL